MSLCETCVIVMGADQHIALGNKADLGAEWLCEGSHHPWEIIVLEVLVLLLELPALLGLSTSTALPSKPYCLCSPLCAMTGIKILPTMIICPAQALGFMPAQSSKAREQHIFKHESSIKGLHLSLCTCLEEIKICVNSISSMNSYIFLTSSLSSSLPFLCLFYKGD